MSIIADIEVYGSVFNVTAAVEQGAIYISDGHFSDMNAQRLVKFHLYRKDLIDDALNTFQSGGLWFGMKMKSVKLHQLEMTMAQGGHDHSDAVWDKFPQ